LTSKHILFNKLLDHQNCSGVKVFFSINEVKASYWFKHLSGFGIKEGKEDLGNKSVLGIRVDKKHSGLSHRGNLGIKLVLTTLYFRHLN
jgi:hypothetical protein